MLRMIRQHTIKYAGNARLKIFGQLNCAAGKRMKIENRVFFKERNEALCAGFRPCARCMPKHYREWRKSKTREA
jgi:methylphosphotriester-DNA--protein-cysteine methyltransferase